MTRSRLWPLLPLVPMYGAAQALHAASYARGWRRVHRLAWPVVSVGNLSVGGAGKTPLVIALARALTARGWQVDVLSRGYGRTSRSVERIDPEYQGDAAARYGDEPWLIAQAAGVPVFVGRDRVAAGRLAEQGGLEPGGNHRRVHLLDDGMQHRRLARDVEMVVLHASDFATTLLPAGRLREPLAALARAHFAVLREEDAALAPRVRRWLRSDATLMQVHRALQAPPVPGPAIVFSAIAHPAEFTAGLRSAGVQIAANHAWRDHHRFTAADIALLRRLVVEHHAQCLVTTEKDAVRLTASQRSALQQAAPLMTARLTAMVPEAAVDALEARLLSIAPAPEAM